MAQASLQKPIFGSVETLVETDADMYVPIGHLVIKGSSEQVIDGNITRSCTVEHIRIYALISPGGFSNRILLVDAGFHSYLPLNRLKVVTYQESPSLPCLCAALSTVEVNTFNNWAKLRRVVNRAHKCMCGHALYSDIQT